MKFLLLLLLVFSFSFSNEKFYGIELGTDLTDDFYTDGNKRGGYEYVKKLNNDSFDFIYAKTDNNKKISGIMLYKENINDGAGKILFMDIAQKLKEKYGNFECTESVNRDGSGKNNFCSTTYKKYKISYSFSHSMFLAGMPKFNGGVSVRYDLHEDIKNLDKL